MRMVLTTCAYCGCGCNLYLHINDSEGIVGVSPSASHPVSNGRLCVKGWRGFSFVNHGERLKKPLIKQKNGTFIETSWDRAISIVSNRLKNIMDSYGPKSIGVLASARCTNEENYLMTKISRSVFMSPNIDHCARL